MAASESELSKFYNDWMDKLQKKAEEAVGEAIKNAYARYFILAEEKIKSIFHTAVDHFYSSQFEPNRYQRRFSMKEILNTRVSKDSLAVSFDPSKMTYRSGYDGEDGLYDLVFREGWHGGAKKGPEHPEEGVPHWRYPDPLYKYWGREAEREDVSPLQEIRRSWSDYEENEMQKDFNAIFNEELENMSINWFD